MFFYLARLARYIFMILFGAKGSWYEIDTSSQTRRFCSSSFSGPRWTYFIPKDKKLYNRYNTLEKVWYSRRELLLGIHMGVSFDDDK